MLYKLGVDGDQTLGDDTVKLKAVPEFPVPCPTVLPFLSTTAIWTCDEEFEELWTRTFTRQG